MTNAGAGGEKPTNGGAGGEGGSAGAGDNGEAARLAKCQTLCATPVDSGSGTPASCGDESACVTAHCTTTGWAQACVDVLDQYLTCLQGADPSLFVCTNSDGTGGIVWDQAGYVTCKDVFLQYSTCESNNGSSPN